MKSILVLSLLVFILFSCGETVPSIKEMDVSAYSMEAADESIEREAYAPQSSEPPFLPALQEVDEEEEDPIEKKIIKLHASGSEGFVRRQI